MAYGERNFRKAPGEYGPVDILGMGIASAFGIAAAIVFDLTQHDEASALFLMNEWVGKLTDTVGAPSVPLYGVVLLLMALGGGSILYFQPSTMKGAFAQGFGALAALMTVAPSDLGSALPGNAEDPLPPALQSLPPADAIIEPASFAAATTAAQSQGYGVRIKVVFPNGLDRSLNELIRRGGLRGRLYNETTNQTYNLFRAGGGELEYKDDALYVSTFLPGNADEAVLWARVEAEGYKITVENFSADQGANPVWTINMRPSNTPLFVQRLRHSYDF